MTTPERSPLPVPAVDYVVDWTRGVPEESPLSALAWMGLNHPGAFLAWLQLPEGMDIFGASPDEARARSHLVDFVERDNDLVKLFVTTRMPERARAVLPRWWIRRWPRFVWIGLRATGQSELETHMESLLALGDAPKFLYLAGMREAVDLDIEWCRSCGLSRARLDAQAKAAPEHSLGMIPRCPMCNALLTHGGWCTDLLGWVVVTAEEGEGAVPLDTAWIAALADCEHSVPLYVVSVGTRPLVGVGESAQTWSIAHPRGTDEREWPSVARHREWPAGLRDVMPIPTAPRAPLPGLVSRDWAARTRTLLGIAAADGYSFAERVYAVRREPGDRDAIDRVEALLDTVTMLYDDNDALRGEVARVRGRLAAEESAADAVGSDYEPHATPPDADTVRAIAEAQSDTVATLLVGYGDVVVCAADEDHVTCVARGEGEVPIESVVPWLALHPDGGVLPARHYAFTSQGDARQAVEKTALRVLADDAFPTEPGLYFVVTMVPTWTPVVAMSAAQIAEVSPRFVAETWRRLGIEYRGIVREPPHGIVVPPETPLVVVREISGDGQEKVATFGEAVAILDAYHKRHADRT